MANPHGSGSTLRYDSDTISCEVRRLAVADLDGGDQQKVDDLDHLI